MMFRDVIAVEAGAVIFFHQVQPIGIKPVEGGLSAIHMIEHAELHPVTLLTVGQSGESAQQWHYAQAPLRAPVTAFAKQAFFLRAKRNKSIFPCNQCSILDCFLSESSNLVPRVRRHLLQAISIANL